MGKLVVRACPSRTPSCSCRPLQAMRRPRRLPPLPPLVGRPTHMRWSETPRRLPPLPPLGRRPPPMRWSETLFVLTFSSFRANFHRLMRGWFHCSSLLLLLRLLRGFSRTSGGWIQSLVKMMDEKEADIVGALHADLNKPDLESFCHEMLLDTQAVKTILLEITGAASYSKFVSREMSKAEALLKVFLMIRKSLKRCSALTKNQTLFNLFKVFHRILRAYAAKLFARLPKGGTWIVAAATGTNGQIKTSDREEKVCQTA